MSVQSTFKSLLLFAPFVLSGTTVEYRTYTDDTCETEAVTMSGETGRVTLDLEATCNPTPDSSIDGLECFLDGIRYVNHPNTDDCTADPICNLIPIGECVYFPGPVPSWKWIDADTYDCHTPGYGVLPECEEDAPTLEPTPGPTDTPQTEGPTNEPTVAPTNGPTVAPTQGPTDAPTAPTQAPTDAPTAPTAPTETPTPAPTASTEIPTAAPSNNPTSSETDSPATDTPVETTTWTVVVTSVLSDLTLNEWDDSTEELYINGLSTSLDIPISRISILSVTSGSIVVESEVTDFQDAASAEAVVSVAADPDAFTFDESLGAVEVEISDPVEVTVESSEETDSEPGSNPLTLISGATRGVDSHEHSVSMVIGVVMGTGLLRR